jgi:hypothetical protein
MLPASGLHGETSTSIMRTIWLLLVWWHWSFNRTAALLSLSWISFVIYLTILSFIIGLSFVMCLRLPSQCYLCITKIYLITLFNPSLHTFDVIIVRLQLYFASLVIDYPYAAYLVTSWSSLYFNLLQKQNPFSCFACLNIILLDEWIHSFLSTCSLLAVEAKFQRIVHCIISKTELVVWLVWVWWSDLSWVYLLHGP